MQNLCVLEQTDYVPFQPLEKSNQYRDALKRLQRMKALRKSEVRQCDPDGLTLLEKVKIVNSRARRKAEERWFIAPAADNGVKLIESQRKPLALVRQDFSCKSENFAPAEKIDPRADLPWSDTSELQDQWQLEACEKATVAGVLFATQNPSWSEFESILNQLDFSAATPSI